MELIMAFVLVTVVEGKELEDRFYFRNIHRCNQFAYSIEHGSTGPDRRRYHSKQQNITAYCIPRRLSKNSKFWD